MELEERDREVLAAVLALTERGETPTVIALIDEVGDADDEGARTGVPLRLTRLQAGGLVIGPRFAGWLGEEEPPTAGWSLSRPAAERLGILS